MPASRASPHVKPGDVIGDMAADDERPPPYLGDYPHGSYWSAVRPDDATDDDDDDVPDYTVEGSALRVMWDTGAGPLWADGDGLLPVGPDWLKRALGLSDALVADLLAWQRHMDAAKYPPTPGLDQEAEELVERLRDEVGHRFDVRYDR